MNRIDRLTAILTHLQGKNRVPIEELEGRFEVSRRTIFRDIKSLIEGGVPIGGDAGEGYFIVEGYHLPPVVFDKHEAAAILMGAKFIEFNSDGQTIRQMQSAMHKVRAVLRYADRDFLESIDSRTEIIGTPLLKREGLADAHLSDIQLALAAKRVLQIEYYSNYSDTVSQREVEPLGLVYYSNRWHLIGHCRLRKDMRDFRTDRIQNLRISGESYDPEQHPSFQDFVHGMTSGTDAKEGVIRFTRKMARFIGDQKYYYGFIDQKEVEDGIEMTFITPRYEFLAQWILSFVANAEAVSPPELQGLVATYSKQLFEHHQKYFMAEKTQ